MAPGAELLRITRQSQRLVRRTDGTTVAEVTLTVPVIVVTSWGIDREDHTATGQAVADGKTYGRAYDEACEAAEALAADIRRTYPDPHERY